MIALQIEVQGIVSGNRGYLIIGKRPKDAHGTVHPIGQGNILDQPNPNLLLHRVPIPDHQLLKLGRIVPEVAVIDGPQVLAFLLHTVVDALQAVVVDDQLDGDEQVAVEL